MGARVATGSRARDARGGSRGRDTGRGSTKTAGVRDKGPGEIFYCWQWMAQMGEDWTETSINSVLFPLFYKRGALGGNGREDHTSPQADELRVGIYGRAWASRTRQWGTAPRCRTLALLQHGKGFTRRRLMLPGKHMRSQRPELVNW